jgi:hypothetical protein
MHLDVSLLPLDVNYLYNRLCFLKASFLQQPVLSLDLSVPEFIDPVFAKKTLVFNY